MASRFIVAAVLGLATGVLAVPMPSARADPAPLSVSAVSTLLNPWGYYAAAGYCAPEATLTWTCGAFCNASADFKPVASGGDGVVTQYWYVGYDPTYKAVVVGHQGTKFENIIPALTDANIALVTLDDVLFPGLGIESGILVHAGFKIAHALVAQDVLNAVTLALATYSATSVTTVGHSLGGSLALLDAVFLPLHLPNGTTFKTYTYGQPRVGNQAFADYVDSTTSRVSLVRTTNKRDPVPILPGRFLLFEHAAGEVHIDDPSGIWYSCPGQENESELCELGDVPTLIQLNGDDHTGPYGNVTMGDC